MQLRMFKLRFRRRLRKSQRQAETFGHQTEADLERYLFRRFASARQAWRFITTWIGLLLIIVLCLLVQIGNLSNHYQSLKPVAGGTYVEGIIGSFTNANPMFATGEVNSSVAKLLFAGLFTYDSHNKLIGDLASGYAVDDKGVNYTVTLRPNLQWHDGTPLTADDVVFTYTTIQNPDVQSPLASGWIGVKVTKINNLTVQFTLSNPLAAFPHNLTNGIVPQHLLAKYPVQDLRSADFNTLKPVGAGPFAWGGLQVKNARAGSREVLVALKPFAKYHTGQPKLTSVVVDIFSDRTAMISAFQHQRINSMVGLPMTPDSVAHQAGLHENNLILTAANMVFFNTQQPVMSDPKVRQALIAGTQVANITNRLGYTTRTVNEPFLTGQLGYDKSLAQSSYNPVTARSLLDQAGWQMNQSSSGRTKAGQALKITLYASDTPENRMVTTQLRHDWRDLGVDVTIDIKSDDELQGSVSAHEYDALLYGISIGVDPDVFVYWHSSQTDARSSKLNFSQYKSAVADTALDAGRTRLDPLLRAVKYRPFLQAWQQDAPAMGLYQPRFLYITNETIYGLDAASINSGIDRFNNVQNWEVRTAKVTNN